MSSERIAVMGCGWLGLPLSEHLLEKGHFVRGSSTSIDKLPLMEEMGIEPWHIKSNPEFSGDDPTAFFDVDTVILSFPPPKVENKPAFMERQAREIVQYCNDLRVKRIIIVSSTGVYGFQGQNADETDVHPPETENGKGLRLMEDLLLKESHSSVSIVRMAGLIGPDRNPGQFLSGKKLTGNGKEPVNLIHLKDAIGVIAALIDKPELQGIYNACASEHPSRVAFYSHSARVFGFPKPLFEDSKPRPWKRIISDRIRKDTGYQFVYDNPVDALKEM